MKKKKILIFLNRTSLAHTQILNFQFLSKLSKNNDVTIVSNYNLNKSRLLKKFNIDLIKIQKNNPKGWIKKHIYNFLKSVKLHTTKNFNHNNTLKDFKSVYINSINNNYKFINIFYLFFWIIIHNLIKIQFFAKPYRVFESYFFYSKNIENLLLRKKPDLIMITSPGWWEDDNFILYSSIKLKIRTICLILSWDQPTGMGFMSAVCNEYLVWSKNVKNDLIKFHNVSKDIIHILGAIHWDHYFSRIKTRKKKSKQVLICLKSPTRTDHLSILFMLKSIINQKYRFKIKFLIRPHPIYFSKRYYKLINDIEKIPSNTNNTFFVQKLWGKNSPKLKDLIEKSPNLNFLIDNENIFRVISKKNISDSNLIINFFSTYTIESSILKTPIINYIYDKKIKNIAKLENKKNLYMDLRQNHVQRIIKKIETAKNFNQLTKMIDLYLSKPNKNKKNLERFFKEETNIIGKSIYKISQYLNKI